MEGFLNEMKQKNIMSVSWTDHLIFGKGEDRLKTPEILDKHIKIWRDELNADTIYWRLLRKYIDGSYHIGRGYKSKFTCSYNIGWNDIKTVPKIANDNGLKPYLYVSIFDEGFPLAPKKIREVSYHNKHHFQHISWQSKFSQKNPNYTIVDRSGKRRQWGVLCLGYPEVRDHFRIRFLQLINNSEFDGLFICLRSQSKPALYADLYGFNEPIRKEYQKRYGVDICKEDFDLQSWRDLNGEYLTVFLSEMRESLKQQGIRLSIGVSRGDILGPPLGNTTLHWREWVKQKIIDELIINQNSSKCPSLGHKLWLMHRGIGYIQNYIDGSGMPDIQNQIKTTYTSIFNQNKSTNLYIARQWDKPSKKEETKLIKNKVVKGLVFSSFKHDNPNKTISEK